MFLYWYFVTIFFFILRGKIDGSECRYVFNKLSGTFQNGDSILHSHKQDMQITMAPYPPYVGITSPLNFKDFEYETVSHYALN